LVAILFGFLAFSGRCGFIVWHQRHGNLDLIFYAQWTSIKRLSVERSQMELKKKKIKCNWQLAAG